MHRRQRRHRGVRGRRPQQDGEGAHEELLRRGGGPLAAAAGAGDAGQQGGARVRVLAADDELAAGGAAATGVGGGRRRRRWGHRGGELAVLAQEVSFLDWRGVSFCFSLTFDFVDLFL